MNRCVLEPVQLLRVGLSFSVELADGILAGKGMTFQISLSLSDASPLVGAEVLVD